jgi:hypothetical protein
MVRHGPIGPRFPPCFPVEGGAPLGSHQDYDR